MRRVFIFENSVGSKLHGLPPILGSPTDVGRTWSSRIRLHLKHIQSGTDHPCSWQRVKLPIQLIVTKMKRVHFCDVPSLINLLELITRCVLASIFIVIPRSNPQRGSFLWPMWLSFISLWKVGGQSYITCESGQSSKIMDCLHTVEKATAKL